MSDCPSDQDIGPNRPGDLSSAALNDFGLTDETLIEVIEEAEFTAEVIGTLPPAPDAHPGLVHLIPDAPSAAEMLARLPRISVATTEHVNALFRRFVYLKKGKLVADMNQPRLVLTLDEFHHALASVKINDAPWTRIWLKSHLRMTAVSTTFRPGWPRFTDDPHGVDCVNTWVRAPHTAPHDWAERVQPFLDHVTYLIPASADREALLDWLAAIEQRPGELPHYHFLLVSPVQGIGRNWVVSALARVWSGYVGMDVKLGAVLKEGGFTGILSEKLLVSVDELHAGEGSRFVHAEQLKAALTTERREINIKYGRQSVEWNVCRWLMLSNHRASLPLPATDRRFWVIETASQPRSPDTYTRLYGLLNDGAFINSIREWMQRRDLRGYNPGRKPPMNEAKRSVINSSRGEVDQLLEYLVATWPSDCIAAGRLLDEVIAGGLAGHDGRHNVARQLKPALVAMNVERYPHRLKFTDHNRNRRQEHAYVLRNADVWLSMRSDQVAADIVKGERAAQERDD